MKSHWKLVKAVLSIHAFLCVMFLVGCSSVGSFGVIGQGKLGLGISTDTTAYIFTEVDGDKAGKEAGADASGTTESPLLTPAP